MSIRAVHPEPPARFDAPWQLRTYVIASALVERRLVEPGALAASEDDPLRSWLTTVEQSLLERGLLTAEEIDAEVARQAAAAAARNVH